MEADLIIVDDNDNILGHASCQECHTKKLRHRSAAVLCFKDENCTELLLTRRSENIPNPGRLCFPGGHVDAKETYDSCAEREFCEEVMGDNKEPLSFKQVTIFKKDTDNDPEFLALYETIFAGPFTADPSEVSECFFMNLDDLRLAMTSTPESFAQTAIAMFEEYYRCRKMSDVMLENVVYS